MFAMLARAIQYFLGLVGLLFIGVAFFNLRMNTAPAAGGFFDSLEEHLKIPLFLFLGFLCLVGAYRISRRRSKTSESKTFPDHKG